MLVISAMKKNKSGKEDREWGWGGATEIFLITFGGGVTKMC